MSVSTHDTQATHRPAEPDDVRHHRPATTSRRRRAVAASALLAMAVSAAVVLWALRDDGTSVLAAPAGPLQENGTELVRDGVEKGFLTGFRDEDGAAVVVVNRAVVLSGAEAQAESERRGLEPPPNDVLLVDDDPRLRDYAVSPDARVTITVGLAPAEAQGDVESSLVELRQLLRAPSGETLGGYLFDLVVEDGVVVELRHVYLV